jgi:hypothetical protein
VILHLHEVDRDAAKLIREGRAREALSLYDEAERVTVSDTSTAPPWAARPRPCNTPTP